eukprot:g9750.t1
MSSAPAAGYHRNGALPFHQGGEVEGDTAGVEAVCDDGGGTAHDAPVIDPALVYNRQGEVVEVDADVVKAVDGFAVPDGYVRKGARDGSFMYSLGAYIEAVEGESHKYFCLASGACRRSRKVIPCKRGDRSNVNTHHRSAHGLQGRTGVMKTEKKKMAQGGIKDCFAASKNSGDRAKKTRLLELLSVKLLVEKCLPFNFFSTGAPWTELMATLATAETTPCPELLPGRVKHLIVEMFVAAKKAVVGNMQQEIAKATLPIIHYGLDLCTCKASGRRFLRVYVSYVDSNFALQHALLAVKHYAPSSAFQESEEKASETLFTIFRATLAEHGIKLSDLAGGTTGSGPELEAMCANILAAVHGIAWDRCDCRLADKAAERAFVASSSSSYSPSSSASWSSPRKTKHPEHHNRDAGDVIRLVVETAKKADRSGTLKQRRLVGEEASELETLNQVLEIAEHAAPQRWLCLVRVMERIIRAWHSLARAYADDGDQFPLDQGSNMDDFLQLYSLLQPLSAITRDGGGGEGAATPTTAEMHLLFAKLKAMVLDPDAPLRVFDVPPPATTGLPPEEAEANGAAAIERHEGDPASKGLRPGRSWPNPLPFNMVPSDQLRPATVGAREELSRVLVHEFYSRIWHRGTAHPSPCPLPSPFRDAAVLLTPPFVSGKYLEALRLTAADRRFLPATAGEEAGPLVATAPTTEEEVAGKLDAAWADIRARASQATREEQRRSVSKDDGGGADQQQPLRKRPRVKGSASSGPATPGGFASFGWGGEPSVFAAFGNGETGDSTEDEDEEDGDGMDSDGRWMDAAVAEEVDRYREVLIKPKELGCQNVLTWWRRTGQKTFPYLAPVAQQVLGHRGPAAPRSDRDSNGYCSLLTLNRSRTDTYWAEMVMFLKENFEHIPAAKDMISATISAKEVQACLPSWFHGRDADLVAAEAAFDVLSNTKYPAIDDIGLEG